MEQWQRELDKWLTTPPEELESNFYCDGEKCGEPFFPDEYVYEVDGQCFCKECALEWLELHRRRVTEGDCYGT